MQDPLQSVAADDRTFARFSMIAVFFSVDGLAHAVFVNLSAWSARANSPTSGFGNFGSPSYRDPSRSFARHPTNHFRNTAKHESLVVMDHPLLGRDLLGSRESNLLGCAGFGAVLCEEGVRRDEGADSGRLCRAGAPLPERLSRDDDDHNDEITFRRARADRGGR